MMYGVKPIVIMILRFAQCLIVLAPMLFLLLFAQAYLVVPVIPGVSIIVSMTHRTVPQISVLVLMKQNVKIFFSAFWRKL